MRKMLNEKLMKTLGKTLNKYHFTFVDESDNEFVVMYTKSNIGYKIHVPKKENILLSFYDTMVDFRITDGLKYLTEEFNFGTFDNMNANDAYLIFLHETKLLRKLNTDCHNFANELSNNYCF